MHLSCIHLPRDRAWLFWCLAAGFYFVALFHRMSMGVASLEATERFGIGSGALAAFTALQLGLYLAMQIPAGLAADRVGPRRALAAGLALMAAGELVFAFTTGFGTALAGRALVGIGDAFIFLNVLRLAQNWFPARRYPLLASLTGMAGALGQVLTTLPLGAALGGLGWTTTFAASGVLTGLLAVLCIRVVRDSPAGAPAPAAAHAAIGATLRKAWATPATRLGFWSHFALMGPFVTLTALWGYPYLVRGRGLSGEAAGAILLGTVLAFATAAAAIGPLVGRRPELRTRLIAGPAAALPVAWALALAWPGGAPVAVLALAFGLVGAAGAAGMLAFDVAREGNPAERSGAATGLVNLGGFTAAVASQVLIGALLGLGSETPDGFRVAFVPFLALVTLAAIRLLHALPRRPRTRVGVAAA